MEPTNQPPETPTPPTTTPAAMNPIFKLPKYKQSRSHKRVIIMILIIIAGAAVIAAGVIAGLYLLHQQTLVNGVKADLKKMPAIMETAHKSTGAYPASLPASQLSIDNAVTIVGSGSFDGTTYCFTGTSKENTSIVYHIDSANSTKDPQSGSCSSATNLPAPTSVSSLAAASLATDQITLTWSPATYASSYTIQCSTDSGFASDVISSTVTTTTGACTGLKSATEYNIRVRGNGSSQAGAWSTVLTATTSKMSAAPASMTSTKLTPTSASYSWTSVDGATSYIVEVSSDINFIKGVVSKTLSASQTTVTFDGLTPNTSYFIHIKAPTADFDASQAAFGAEVPFQTPAS